MLPKFRWLLACMALGLTGCDIDVKGLRETAAAIDKFSDQIRQTAGDNGDLQKLLAQAKKDVHELIEKAEKAGGRLEEKVVLDFIEQRKQTIQEISRLVRESGTEIQGRMFPITEEFSQSLNRLPPAVSNQLLKVVAAVPPLIPGIFLSKNVLETEGTELIFRTRGYSPRIIHGKRRGGAWASDRRARTVGSQKSRRNQGNF